MAKWYTKVRHYRGGTSIIGSFDTKEAARDLARERNDQYHTDNYYAEEHDPEKFDWPSAAISDTLVETRRGAANETFQEAQEEARTD